MKKLFVVYVLFILLLGGYSYYFFTNIYQKNDVVEENNNEVIQEEVITEQESENEGNEDPYIQEYFFIFSQSYLNSSADLGLYDVDGTGSTYRFNYSDMSFTALHEPENWRILDSYLINNADDMKIICQALIDIYPIHGKDYSSYRTADDMVYEWQIHNFVYDMLPEDNSFRNRVRDVDFNPEDQNKTYEDYFKEYTGIDYNKIYSGNN